MSGTKKETSLPDMFTQRAAADAKRMGWKSGSSKTGKREYKSNSCSPQDIDLVVRVFE